MMKWSVNVGGLDAYGEWGKKAKNTHQKAMELTKPLSFYALQW